MSAVVLSAVVRWLLGALAPALLLLFALSIATPPAHAQAQPADKRIALVIGNARYPKVPLSNPENDARLIAANLRKLGFEVNEQLNVNVLQFRRALREFARRVQEDDSIAVLYYAGHGVQIDGRNYLLPVDIDLRDQEEVKDESVDIEELFLSRIDKARSHPRIVILDACRDNPFAAKTRNIRSAGGLAEMGARGTLIAFASAPGAPAEDGPSGRNSVYTKNLAEEMMVPGLEVEQMFKNVRVKVLRDTRDRQLPWVNTSLTSNFSFNPVANAPVAVEPARRPQAQRQETTRAGSRGHDFRAERTREGTRACAPRARRSARSGAPVDPAGSSPTATAAAVSAADPGVPAIVPATGPATAPASAPAGDAAGSPAATPREPFDARLANAQVPGPGRGAATPGRQDAHPQGPRRGRRDALGPPKRRLDLLQQPERRQLRQQRLGPLGTQGRRQSLRQIQCRAAVGPADRRAQARQRLLVLLP